MKKKEIICGCTVCMGLMYEGDKLADHHVYKYGELSYIELAHKSCAIREDSKRVSNGTGPNKYWRYAGSIKGDKRREKKARRKAGLDHPIETANWEGDAVRCLYRKIQPNRYPAGLRRKAYFDAISG